jgi:Tfp pilus assembly protein PilX
MKHLNHNSRQRGAALIVGLVLLAVITLLAVVGMNISNSELASANSEQIRIRAFQAAESGLEHGIVMVENGTAQGTRAAPHTEDPVGVAGSPKDQDDNAIDTYTLTTAHQGDGTAPGYGNQFRAFHFSIESQGRSARNTLITNETGAFVVNGKGGGTGTFEALPE